MVSPQQQKLDEVDRISRSFSAPITWIPSIGLDDHRNRHTQDGRSGGSPNKRTYEQASLSDPPASDINNNTKVPNPFDVDKLEVIPATDFHLNLDEDYKMSSAERGYCVIINNVDFGNTSFTYRKGSDMDAFRLKKIWTKLGFKVVCKRNQTSENMMNQFRHTAALCKHEHDAVVVILLSHGSEHGVFGVDGIEVDLNDVLNTFDNKRCKRMQGKPKVFFVQACRGRMLDEGVSQSTTQQCLSQLESQPSQWTQLNSQVMRMPRWGTFDSDHSPLRTDMLLCFSTQWGYVSHRNEEEGSWMGTSLAIHLCRQAHRRHLMDILNMVSRDLRQRRSASDLKQALEVNCLGFDKNLFLNPGLFK